MSTTIDPYQGGMPLLYSRYGPRQTGSGFFSSLKRFLIPIAKSTLPHLAGAVGDLVSGKSVMDVAKSRGRAAGASLLHNAADMMQQPSNASLKNYKRKAPVRKKPVSSAKRVKTSWK